MKRLVIVIIAVFAGIVLLGGKKSAAPELVTLNASMPVLDTVPGFAWEQVREGVSISLIPVPLTPHIIYHKTLAEKPKGLFSLSTGNAVTYIVTDAPVCYLFKPDSLSFQLHITNRLNHVLRFAGCLVSFTVDGKSLPVNTRTQDELLRAVILPQGSLDLTIMGPPVNPNRVGDTTKTVLDGAKTISVAIYDVTIEVDAANNPTKRATFEWIFANNPQVLSTTLPKVLNEAKITPADAAKYHDTWFMQ